MSKHRIKVSYVLDLLEKRQEINNLAFQNILWTDDNGVPLDISKRVLDDFPFLGLNNCDFISMGCHLKKENQDE